MFCKFMLSTSTNNRFDASLTKQKKGKNIVQFSVCFCSMPECLWHAVILSRAMIIIIVNHAKMTRGSAEKDQL